MSIFAHDFLAPAPYGKHNNAMGASLVASWLVACSAVGQTSTPNIVLIYADDQGWTGTSVLMDPAIPDSRSDFYLTPRLEALASQGMRFSNAYSSGPVCSPSRAALITGKSPAQLQFTDVVGGSVYWTNHYQALYTGHPLSPPLVPTSLPESEISIAEHFEQRVPAYRTALIGKWHLTLQGEITALDQGFDFWASGNTGAPPDEDPKDIFGITAATNQFMQDSVNAGQPFLVIVAHYAPHTPWEARPELVKVYEALPPGDRHDDPVYAAMIEDLDTGVGMVLDMITELGIEDNTYVFYTSDNGAIALLGDDENDPLFNAKGTVYEGGIRVPWIVRGPGIEPNSVCTTPVVGHDLFTTFSSLVGAGSQLPEGVEGADLTPLLLNGGELPVGMDSLSRTFAPHGELYFHFPHYINGGESPRVPMSAVRHGDFKLLRVYSTSGVPDTLLLFDLSQTVEESGDPESPLNLADDMPQLAADLNAMLEQWLQATDASLAYDVAEDVLLEWDAADPGADPTTWRSTIDVDYLHREAWTLDALSGAPTIVAAPPPFGSAFRFDGGDGMRRKFFHVSDPVLPDTYDADHSASIELWIRVDDLAGPHILFESGGGTAGLSLTMGDAIGNLANDDVRFRILGSDGNHLTLTARIGPVVDPTTQFIQLVAVFRDDPLSRSAILYVNGVPRGWVDGLGGPDEIDWDSVDDAGLGRAAGALGGNGGSGDLPFPGANFAGEIAMFRFNNYAISGAEVLARYFAVRPPLRRRHVTGTGPAASPDSIPR